MTLHSVEGNIVDIFEREIFPGRVYFRNGKIKKIEKTKSKARVFIIPGFVDAHVHIESSMVTPVSFSRMAVKHGTIAAVSDPHEIANVMGVAGVRFMVENGMKTPFKFLFGAPSCVPATPFETSGASITAEEIKKLLEMEGIGFMAEMMNYPGVILKDKKVWEKLMIAKAKNVVIDGHAPGVRGNDLLKYVEAGITTDHECTTLEEAKEKINAGMKILIREGSGAKNLETLMPLIELYPESIMFCTDDCHPDDLTKGHVNELVRRSISKGFDLFNVLRAASLNAIRHYGLNMGMVRVHDPGDLIIVDDLEKMDVVETYINGRPVFQNGLDQIKIVRTEPINNIAYRRISEDDIRIERAGEKMNVIEVIDGELITKKKVITIPEEESVIGSDIVKDILKIVVINRYDPRGTPVTGFISGFGLKRGAIASSIAHDSHNVICVGAEDRSTVETINWIFQNQGGIAIHDGDNIHGIPLPVAGLMTEEVVENVGAKYNELSHLVGQQGSKLSAPFMTLSFMALLVIPSLKIGDRGLFDVNAFSFTPLFES